MGELFEQQYPNNVRTISGLINTPYQDDVTIECDTSLGAVALSLLGIPANKWSTQYKLYVIDKSNNAGVNNITINAPVGFLINGASSVVINVSGGSYIFRVASNTNYIGQYSATISSPPALVSLPVFNTLFVAKNGSDATGLPERFDKPFLTIAGARASAIAFFVGAKLPSVKNRILIKVFSGDYDETIVLDKFIDYDLSDITINTINSDIISDAGLEVNSIIYGNANLKSTCTQGAVFGINISNDKSSVVISINDLEINSVTPSTIRGVNCIGVMRLSFNNLIVTSTIAVNVIGILVNNGGKLYANAIGDVSTFGVGLMNGMACINANSELHFNGNNISVSGGVNPATTSACMSAQIGGKAWVKCNDVTLILAGASQQLYGSAVNVGGATSPQLYLKCNRISVNCTTSSPYISCCRIGRSNGSALTESAILQVDCYQATINGERPDTQVISSQNTDANCVANFKGRYVINGGVFADCDVVDLLEDGTNANARIILDNATIIPKGIGFSVASTLAHNVYIYGGCQSTRPVNANITELVTTIVVDPLVI